MSKCQFDLEYSNNLNIVVIFDNKYYHITRKRTNNNMCREEHNNVIVDYTVVCRLASSEGKLKS